MDTNNGFDPVKEGATQFNPTQQGATPVTTQQKPISDALDKSGVGNIPVIGGLLKGAIQPVVNTADQALSEQGKMSGPLFGLNIPSGTKTYASDIANNPSKLPSDVANIAGNQAGAATTITAGMDLPSIINAVKSAPQLLKYLSKGGLANITTKAASDAGAAGSQTTWDSIKMDIQDEVKKALGSTKEVNASLDNFLNDLPKNTTKTVLGNPAGGVPDQVINQSAQASPKDLLDMRRQITARGAGGNIFSNLFKGSNIDDKVSAIGRRVLSANLHDIAPATKVPDRVYTIYKKLGGDVPTWVKRIVAGTVADKTIGNKFGGPIEGAIDLLAGSRF